MISALEKNILAKFSYVPNYLDDMEIIENNNHILINSKLPCDMFNMVCAHGSMSDKDIIAAINFFRHQNLPAAWWCGFEGEDEKIKSQLEAHNLVSEEAELAMSADITSFSFNNEHAKLQIKQVTSQHELIEFINVIAALLPEDKHSIEDYYLKASNLLLYKYSKLKLFVGQINKKPVSTASVFFDNKVAGIYDIITLPDVRGQGIGKAMTANAMDFAKNHGYRTATLTATNDAKYLYEKLGFTALKEMCVYEIKL